MQANEAGLNKNRVLFVTAISPLINTRRTKIFIKLDVQLYMITNSIYNCYAAVY